MSEAKLQDGASPFIIESCILGSSRTPLTFDITSSIADFIIYENINKPYLTGKLSYLDSHAALESMVYGGDEFIDIIFKRPGNENKVQKRFHLDRIMGSSKANEKAEAYFFHMTEDSQYKSIAVNVNKYYSGKPIEIIQDILKTFTNKEVKFNPDNNDASTPMKVIIPNLNPFSACDWIKNRAITNNGLPFVLYQPLKNDFLIYTDFGTLLTQRVVNPTEPFVDWSSGTMIDDIPNTNQILNYNFNNTENLMDYVSGGSVGAEYSFYDTSTGSFKNIKLDIRETFERLRKEKVINNDTLSYVYPLSSKIDNTFLSELSSTNISTYPSTGSFNQGFTNYTSYTEETNYETYERRVAGVALKNILLKSSMTVTVKGTDFLDKEENFTVGNKVRFLFCRNADNNNSDGIQTLDSRKSGDYLVLASNHSFSKNPHQYSITLFCTKLQNVDSTLLRTS